MKNQVKEDRRPTGVLGAGSVCGWLGLIGAVLASGVLWAQGTARGKLPPKKWSATVLGAFFPDVRQAIGPGQPGAVTPSPAASGPGSQEGGSGNSGSSSIWPQLISAQVLEDEIKRSVTALAQALSTPSKFKSGRHRVARRLFSVNAVLLNIAAQYPEDVRFKRVAPALREAVARSGFNCKVNSDSAFQGARQALELLQSALRGEKIESGQGVEPVVPFPKAADRPPLMQRMEQAQQGRLAPWTASPSEFKANLEEVFHEAQVLAALARVIQDPQYEYGEDETYLEYAQMLEKACRELMEAVKTNNYEQARKAVGTITQSCSDCHGDFRG